MPFYNRDIPFELFLNFFNNHGLFKLKKDRPSGTQFVIEAEIMFLKF